MTRNDEHDSIHASDPSDLSAGGRGDVDSLERILDLPLSIHVQLGSRRMRISDLLELAIGSILDLDTAAGAPLDIYANHTLIAQGEAVVVGDHYGVRITEIVTPAERVKRIGNRGGGAW